MDNRAATELPRRYNRNEDKIEKTSKINAGQQWIFYKI